MSDLSLISPPRITGPHFARILSEAGSPAASEAAACYGAFVAHGFDPALALAFADKEHSMRWLGVAGKTKGWANVVKEAFRDIPDSRSIGAVGRFASYATYADGAHDWCLYMRHRYLDRGITDLGTIISIYAPDSDGNDPVGYAESVRRKVARWQGQRLAPDPWAAWGSAYTLPEAERGYGIPVAWLREERAGRRLGAALSEEVPVGVGALRLFMNGAVVWYRDSNTTRVLR